MAKDKVKKMTGVFASVFAHSGHISKEEAQEISGLEGSHFEEAYQKAGRIAERLMNKEGAKADDVMKHYADEIRDYLDEFDQKFFMT